MLRNVWAVLCRDIITDQETNSVTYVRCIEEGTAASLPVRIGPVYLGTLWEKAGQKPVNVQFRVSLVTPDNTRQTLVQTKTLVMDRARHRLHFRLKAISIEDFGTYLVLLEGRQDQKWIQAARLPVLIRQVDRQAVQE